MLCLRRVINTKNNKVSILKKLIYILFRVAIFALLIVSIVIAIIDEENRSSCLFSVLHSTLFLILSFIPSIIEKKLKYEIPDVMEVAYILFCAANNILGEIGNFYATVSWWDDMLHTMSGVLIAIVGFSLIKILNKNVKSFSASPLFTAIFVVCLAMTIGAIWEIFEFSVDSLVGSNMQRYRDSITQEPFVGQQALVDTMSDLIEAFLGSMIVAITGYIMMVKKKFKTNKLEIVKTNEKYDLSKEKENE